MSRARDISDGKFANDLTVDTNTLKVDSSNNRVGIGNSSPCHLLDATVSSGGASARFGTTHNSGDNDATVIISSGGSGDAMLRFDYEGSNTDRARIGTTSSGQDLKFFTAGNNERGRFDASGRLMVGKTSSSIATQGTVITDDGRVDITPTTTNGSGQTDAIRLHNSGTTAGDGAGIKFSAGTSTTGAGIFGIGQALNSCNLVFRAGGDSERMRVAHTGQVMVGDTTGGSYSDGGLFTRHAGGANNSPFCVVNGTTSGTRRMVDFFVGTGTSRVGSIQSNDSATAFNTSSDYRLKENVADMTGAIDRVKALAPKRFNFIISPDTIVDGFLAHEVSSIVPEAISGVKDEIATWGKEEKLPDGVKVGDNKLDDDGNTIPIMQGIDHSKLVPLLTAALKESITKIETLETEMTALKARVTTLEAAE